MKLFSAIVIAICLLPAGCGNLQLRHNTMQQTASVLDLQYQQVLDNLAMFESDPMALPSFSEVEQGTLVVDSTATATVNLLWNPFTLMSEVFTPSAVRHWNGNWKLDPICGGARLDAMRVVYQYAVGVRQLGDPTQAACCKFLHDDFCIDCSESLIPRPGWFSVGRKCDVPKCAKFVGSHCDKYVWVLPGGEDSFSRLTLTILAIALNGQTPSATELVAPPKPLRKAAEAAISPALRQQLDSFETLKPEVQKQVLVELQNQIRKLEIENLSRQRAELMLVPNVIEQVPAPAPLNPSTTIAPAFR
ncbi:MAG TPA: hypothetical protein VFE46_15370 [Pirellulales bacterium]|jgi:hypothetical protein|nr:hypothetical protein [Pirellulales bacterium]